MAGKLHFSGYGRTRKRCRQYRYNTLILIDLYKLWVNEALSLSDGQDKPIFIIYIHIKYVFTITYAGWNTQKSQVLTLACNRSAHWESVFSEAS